MKHYRKMRTLGTSKKPFGINIKEKQVSNTITSQARK
jgi:hypothetical protein